MPPPNKNLVPGKVIGLWTLIKRESRHGRSYWLCKCTCGTKKWINANNLGRSSNSCGCTRKDTLRHNMTGKQFYHWTIGEYIGKGYYHVKCSCGFEGSRWIHGIIRGESRSCGCERIKNIKNWSQLNLDGKRFSKLVVMKEAYVRNACTYWYCKCDCGNYHTARGSDLVNNSIKSCGCSRAYKERLVQREVLKNFIGLKVKFNYRPTFLRGLEYDIYFPTLKLAIEIDGRQHYEMVSKFDKTQQDFLKRKKRDYRKNRISKYNNIALWRYKASGLVVDEIIEDLEEYIDTILAPVYDKGYMAAY